MEMDKAEQFMISMVLFIGLLGVGMVIWGLIALLRANELVDILVTTSIIASLSTVFGLIYFIVGRAAKKQEG